MSRKCRDIIRGNIRTINEYMDLACGHKYRKATSPYFSDGFALFRVKDPNNTDGNLAVMANYARQQRIFVDLSYLYEQYSMNNMLIVVGDEIESHLPSDEGWLMLINKGDVNSPLEKDFLVISKNVAADNRIHEFLIRQPGESSISLYSFNKELNAYSEESFSYSGISSVEKALSEGLKVDTDYLIKGCRVDREGFLETHLRHMGLIIPEPALEQPDESEENAGISENYKIIKVSGLQKV